MLQINTDSRETSTYNTRLYEFSLTLLSVANATQSQAEKDGRRPQISPRVVQSAEPTSSRRSLSFLQNPGSDTSFYQSYHNSGRGGGGSSSSSSDQATRDISIQTSLRQDGHPPDAPDFTGELVFPDFVNDGDPFTLLAPTHLDVVHPAASDDDGCCSAELAAFMDRLERGVAFNDTDLLSCADESR